MYQKFIHLSTDLKENDRNTISFVIGKKFGQASIGLAMLGKIVVCEIESILSRVFF